MVPIKDFQNFGSEPSILKRSCNAGKPILPCHGLVYFRVYTNEIV
jgi:hypothetical protein